MEGIGQVSLVVGDPYLGIKQKFVPAVFQNLEVEITFPTPNASALLSPRASTKNAQVAMKEMQVFP
jgi:hypothetical protein